MAKSLPRKLPLDFWKTRSRHYLKQCACFVGLRFISGHGGKQEAFVFVLCLCYVLTTRSHLRVVQNFILCNHQVARKLLLHCVQGRIDHWAKRENARGLALLDASHLNIKTLLYWFFMFLGCSPVTTRQNCKALWLLHLVLRNFWFFYYCNRLRKLTAWGIYRFSVT